MWFADGAFASLSYSGYGHFDSDEWTGWIGEMGAAKNPADHGGARRRLSQAGNAAEEARLKNAGTYGGPSYEAPRAAAAAQHQHFGPVIVSCDTADLRPLPDGVRVHGHAQKWHDPLPAPAVPRYEVIDELHAAVRSGVAPLHDGAWARSTLAVCLALLRSSKEQRDVRLDEVA
jgi:phthalate 4,5-cis-dihydrodiol dehydrogenase